MTAKTILTIRELTRYVKRYLEQNPELRDVWIRGEISNFKHHSRGHMYFTLKDETSRIRAVMFRGNNQYLRFAPQDGMSVLARGEVNVYERDGQYQFYVREMQPDGIGALYQAFEDLKQKLSQKGWFAEEIKKPLPKVPQKIGVITSPTGAAIRDMITTLKRRFPIAEVYVFPVLVQGDQAGRSIARAIKAAHQEALDVLIVGRGGGSIEELWAFNEEEVARAIYEATIPVISAVGHDTDVTIADYVADLRAPTPTAAAELAVPVLEELLHTVNRLEQSMKHALTQTMRNKRQEWEQLSSRYAFKYPRQLLAQKEQAFDQKLEQLKRNMNRLWEWKQEKWTHVQRRLRQVHPQSQVEYVQREHGRLREQLQKAMKQKLAVKEQQWDRQLAKLDALSPLKTMRKGYALVYDGKEAQLIRSAKQVEPGQAITVQMHDGSLDAHVWGIKESEQDE